MVGILLQVQGLVLEELCLHGCKELTDYSLEALVKHQPQLQRLDISGCTELSSRSVEAVAHSLKSLSHLSLSGDWRITEKGSYRGLRNVVNACLMNPDGNYFEPQRFICTLSSLVYSILSPQIAEMLSVWSEFFAFVLLCFLF